MIRWISTFTAFVFALTHTALLSRFIPKGNELKKPAATALFALGVLAQSLVRRLDTRASFWAYAYMLSLYTVMLVFARLWSGKKFSACAQRTICFFLLTECAALAVSYFSQRLLGRDLFRSEPLTLQTLAILLLAAFESLLLYLLHRLLPQEPRADGNSLWLSFLAAIPYLFVSQITLWLPLTNAQITPVIPLMLCASCLLALMLIVSLEGRLHAEQEKRQMLAQHHMTHLQQQQFEMSRSSQETVRRNYHDMKNLLLYLEQTDSREEFRSHVQHILDEIRPYETVLDTGSEVMDILLGEKLSICQQEGISCTVMADGAALAFIKPLDLVAMLGNAMDNAIEACRCLPQQSARYIQLRTARRQGFLLLHVRNSCTGEVNMQGDHFMTTKEDREHHGYGLPSIRRAVQSYGGEMTCRMEDSEFSLTLLFPV